MDFVRPLRCKRLDWRSVFYATQAVEVVLVCVGMMSNHWLEGILVPVPWIRVQMDIGLVETCLTWQDYTACARDMEVFQIMAEALGKRLDYIQTHTFDIPRSFLYVVLGLHFCTVAVLFSEHPLALPRGLNIIQLFFLVVCLCWFGMSSFKQNMCDYLEECSFGWSLYLVLVALILTFFRLVYHFYRFRKDGEDTLDPSELEARQGLGGEGVGLSPMERRNPRVRTDSNQNPRRRALWQPLQQALQQHLNDQQDYALLHSPHCERFPSQVEIELVSKPPACPPLRRGEPSVGGTGFANVPEPSAENCLQK